MKKIWVDGSGNTKPSAICKVIETKNHDGDGIELIISPKRWTNNEAEYRALISGFLESGDAIIYTDSKLVEGQMNEGWKINDEKLKHLHNAAIDARVIALGEKNVEWIPREQNKAGKVLEYLVKKGILRRILVEAKE